VRNGACQCGGGCPCYGRRKLLLPATMTSSSATVEMATAVTAVMATAAMEVATPAEGEANRRPVSVVVGIRLIVIWGRVVVVPAKCPTAVPVTAMSPAAPAATIVYRLDVGGMRHFQPRQTTNRRR
jgi:hypothetical protein